MDALKVARINELASKEKTSGLSHRELEEQKLLRMEYIQSFKTNLVAQLDNVYVMDEKCNKRKLQKIEDDDEE